MNFYLGNLHAHSVYSGDHAKGVATRLNNGVVSYEINTPAVVFQVAHNAGYDFYGVTDHSSPEQNEFYKDGFTEEHWMKTKDFAMECTSSDFLALYGFEFSRNLDPDNGGLGHMSVYCTNSWKSAYAPGNTFEKFYQWMTDEEDPGIVAQFNHPIMTGKTDVKNFNNYTGRTRKRNKIITLAEIWNSKREDKFYEPAVKKIWALGWKVGPTAGNDVHGIEGIPKNKLRTGVLAAELTKDAIMDALRNRRVYATLEPKLQLDFMVNGHSMGSLLDLRPDGELLTEIYVNNPEGGTISRAEVHGGKYDINGGETSLLACIDIGGSCKTSEAFVENGYDFYYVVVFREGDESPIAYTAPVWMDND